MLSAEQAQQAKVLTDVLNVIAKSFDWNFDGEFAHDAPLRIEERTEDNLVLRALLIDTHEVWKKRESADTNVSLSLEMLRRLQLLENLLANVRMGLITSAAQAYEGRI